MFKWMQPTKIFLSTLYFWFIYGTMNIDQLRVWVILLNFYSLNRQSSHAGLRYGFNQVVGFLNFFLVRIKGMRQIIPQN